MTDRAAALAAVGDRITKAGAARDLSDLLSADALRETAALINSTDIASDPTAALILRTFHILRHMARPAEQDPVELAEAAGLLAAMPQALPNADQIPNGELGLCLLSVYERNGDRRLLHGAADLLRAEVEASPAGHPDRPRYLNGRCRVWQLLFELSGNPGFLSAAIATALEAMSAAGPDHAYRPWILSNLGNALCSLSEHSGETGQLTGAIRVYRAALAAARPDSSDRAMILCNLGNALGALARRTGDISQLAEAVQVTRAAADANAGGPNHPAALSNLGIALQAQFQRTGELALLAEAADAARAAVAAAPAEHPSRVGFLAHLGNTLRMLSDRTGDIKWLSEAVQVGRDAVAATPAGHHHRAGHLGFLGMTARMLSERTADTGLLDEAIRNLRAAVQAAPPGSATLLDCMSQLGLALQTQFERTSDIGHLTEAVRVGRKVVAATTPGNPERAVHLSHLGSALQSLYERGGDTSLLLEAVNVKQEALKALPEDHPDRALQLSSLGLAGVALYERTGVADILAEAIKYYRSAMAVIPDDHPDRGTCLCNLGIALRKLFKHTRDSQHLADAIQTARDAVEATSADDHRRGAYLTNLAVVLQDRFAKTRDVRHGAEAVRVSREAVRAARGGHPDRAVFLGNLGWSLVLQATRDRRADVAELGEARRYYLQAAICTEAAARVRIEAYQKAILLADPQVTSDEEALTLLEAAAELLPQLASRGVAGPDRERQLAAEGSLAGLAAAVAVNASRPERAVELLEQTRGLLVADVIDARTSDLTQLREGFPDLAAAFEELRVRLDILGRPSGMSADDRSPEAAVRADLACLTAPEVFQARRDTQTAWTELIKRIRARPGFDSFLAAPRLDRLTEQARSGPVVYVYVSAKGCGALILTGDRETPVRMVRLDDLTETAAQDQAERLLAASRAASLDTELSTRAAAQADLLDILAWLWDAITGPVMTALGHLDTPGVGESWPRMWWCPVGVLACFPLHAAGHHRDPALGGPAGRTSPNTVLDRVISSYTATVRGLGYARAQRLGPASHTALVIAVPDAPDAPSLPSASAEADLLAAVLPGSQVLPHPTREAVLAALPRYQLAHFACHGYASWNNPAASQVVLYDYQTTPLTVADISALRLTGSLAYLSACETTLITPALADEAIHITGAFHLAGYQHVIGTLWPVGDATTHQISGDFYRHLTHHGAVPPDFGHAARALHHATRQLRDQHPDAPSLWAGHTHTGA